MSAEQSAGRPVYASDLYSLGLTAIFALTGKAPQDLDTDPSTGEILWRSYAPQVSTSFATILDKAIHLSLSNRFANVPQMLTALRGVSATVTTAVTPVSPPRPAAGSAPGGIPSAPPVGGDGVATPFSTQPTTPVSPSVQATVGQGSTQPGSRAEWKIAALTGAVIGSFILLAAFVIRAELPKILGKTETPPETSTAPSRTVGGPQSSPAPTQPVASMPPQSTSPPPVSPPAAPPPPAPAPPPRVPTNATIAGHSGSKNIRSGPGTEYGVVTTAYPGDRIQITGGRYNADNYLWYQIYVPKSGTQGWIASHLADLDSSAAPPLPRRPQRRPPPRRPPSRPPSTGTNATIVGTSGSKNIRRGPGTNYGVQHIAYPGDRVRILTSGRDRGGYLWYKVSFPKSGATGWIAAQLINRD